MKPGANFEVHYSEQGKIIDFLDSIELEPTPEEVVRQRFLRTLHYEFGYPKEVMRREVPIRSGSKNLVDVKGNLIRADIVVYRNNDACSQRRQGPIHFVVECKSPTAKDGYNQLV